MSKQTYRKKASPQDWHRADIKAALEKAGWSLAGLSLAHGFSRRSVGMALDQQWPRMEAIIARALHLPPEAIWPSRYNPDGTPTRGRFRPSRSKPSRVERKGDIQDRRVA